MKHLLLAAAIVYGGYQAIGGVLLSTEWGFHPWSEAGGVSDQVKGTGKLSNIRFVEITDDTFTHPEGAREDTKP